MTVLRVEDLNVFLGRSPVVHVDHLELVAGEVIAVVGGAGAGKTTLLAGLAGLESTQGRIDLAGIEVGQRRAHERARMGLALVSTHGLQIDDLVVAELLELPRAVGRRRGRPHLGGNTAPQPGRSWSLYDLADRLPGLERVLHVTLAEVGAWERVAIAIALGLRSGAQVLLVDEPAAGLGDVSQERLRASLGAIAFTGVAVVVATRSHSLAASLAQRRYQLLGGQLLEGQRTDEGRPPHKHPGPAVTDVIPGTDVTAAGLVPGSDQGRSR